MIQTEYLDAIVVRSNDQDPLKAGAVRVKVIGFTDELDDVDQPWAYPMLGKTEKVPNPGSFVKIMVEHGDWAFLQYTQGTTTGQYLSDDYLSNYPDMTISDMGIYLKYDESSHELNEVDIYTGYNRKVDSDGVTSISTPLGFSISDKKRSDNSGVMTSDLVNICCGKPFGQGSQVYSVPTFKSIDSTGTII